MNNDLTKSYRLKSAKEDIDEFVRNNENASEILEAIKPELINHFTNNTYSLEICDKLSWTSEKKLLVNVHMSDEMFFNGMLNHLMTYTAKSNL